MVDDEKPSLHSIPLEIRLRVYSYIFSELHISCNWDMQPDHCSSCSITHDIINVLRVAPEEGHDQYEKRQYSLVGVCRKLRSEALPLIRRIECQFHIPGPTLVIGAPKDCRGQFNLPDRLLPTQHLRSLVLDRSLPQLPRFALLPALEAVILPAPATGAHEVASVLPSQPGLVMEDVKLRKSFMYKLGLYDFGLWTRRVWDTLEKHDSTRQISLRVRRPMFVAGTDRTIALIIDMELHKAPDGRLGPERVAHWTYNPWPQ